MRPTFALAALALLGAMPFPGADAQEGPLLADEEGDVLVTSGDTSAPAPLPANGQTASADLRELALVEGDIDLTFTLKVASLAQQGGSTNRYTMAFRWMDAPFEATLTRSRIDPTSVPITSATLSLCADTCIRITDLEHTLDEAAGTFGFLIPKRYITSLEGHAPVFGSELSGVVVRSLITLDGFPGAPATGSRAEDVMPDAGQGVITYTKGGSSNGHIVLEAPDPVRISNGGATTFVFNSHVQNALDVEDTVTFALEGVPAEWTATAPGPQKVPAGSEKPVFVLATIPFGHQHGGFTTFNLTATSVKDPNAKASLRFGVLHTPTPMPAGHHSELYLHARPADSGVFQTALPRTDVTMSTLAEHGDDAPEAIADVGQEGAISWRIPLAPQLALGVDSDLDRTGSLTASVNGHVDAQGTLSGGLWLVKGDQDIALLGRLADAQVSLTQNAPTTVTSTYTPEAASDYAPYAAGHNLELRLVLVTQGPLPPNPQAPPGLVVKDLVLTLPLNEYADAPSFEEGEGSTIKIEPQGGLEKTARPGTTATYSFLLSTLAATDTEYDVELAGTNGKDSEVTPDGKLRFEPKETKRVTLGVRIPASASDDQRIESILVVRSRSDPSDIALARTATLVSRSAAGADEADAFEAAKDVGKRTPVPAVLVPIATVAVALALARRGR